MGFDQVPTLFSDPQNKNELKSALQHFDEEIRPRGITLGYNLVSFTEKVRTLRFTYSRKAAEGRYEVGSYPHFSIFERRGLL